MYPHKIVKTKVLNNPFSDIVPRETIRKSKTDKEKNKSNAAATKFVRLIYKHNFNFTAGPVLQCRM